MSLPRTNTFPDWILRAPATMLSSVDLPRAGGRLSWRRQPLQCCRPFDGGICFHIADTGKAAAYPVGPRPQQLGIDLQTHAEHQLVAFALRFDCFRRELGLRGG